MSQPPAENTLDSQNAKDSQDFVTTEDVNEVSSEIGSMAIRAPTPARTPDPTPKKMRRTTMSDAQKYEVCMYIQEKQQTRRLTNKSVAGYILERYNIRVDESTVSRLKQQISRRLNQELSNPSARRHRQVMFPELEKQLSEFLKSCRGKIIINDALIVTKGKELAHELNITQDQLTFSDGWLNKFKIRHGLKAAAVPKNNSVLSEGSPRIAENEAPGVQMPDVGLGPNMSASASSSDAPRESPMSDATNLQVQVVAATVQEPGPLSSQLPTITQDSDAPSAMSLTPGSSSSSGPTPAKRKYRKRSKKGAVDELSAGNEEGLTTANIASGMVMKDQPAVPIHDVDMHMQSIHEHDSAAATAMHSSIENDPALHMEMLSKVYATGANNGDGTMASAASSKPNDSQSLELSRPNGPIGTLQTMTQSTLTGAPGAFLEARNSPSGSMGNMERPEGSGPNHSSMSASRADLSMRMADPIAAGFDPEPEVDFREAAQCVHTLRIFMQQQGFSKEQMEGLRGIYLTLDSKRRRL